MRHKKIGRANGSVGHNSVTKGEFLSLAASGHLGQVQESQAIIRVPLLCDDICSKGRYRFKFVCVEWYIMVPDAATVVKDWENKRFVKLGEAWGTHKMELPIQKTHLASIQTELMCSAQDKS